MLVTLSVVVALVPLVWVLYSVISQGLRRRHVEHLVVTNSQAGMTAFAPGGGVYHAIVGTLLQGVVCAVISIPIGIFVAIYLVEYGGGTRLGKLTTFMVDILTGVPSIVAALFIYALWVATLGFPAVGLRGVAGVGAADDPGHRARHRGDAADRPDGSARGELRAGRAEVEDDRAHRDSDRAVGHHHRHHAGAGPGDGRDGAAADPGRLRRRP